MQMRIEVECTPVEARAFMGLPDVTPLNEHLVDEMKRRMDENLAMMGPDQVLKFWTAFGGQAQEQFRSLMTAATSSAFGGMGAAAPGAAGAGSGGSSTAR